MKDTLRFVRWQMFAGQAEAAGVEGTIDDRSARAVRANTVEMWAGVFVSTDRLLELHTDTSLDVIACHT